ncbi:MAG: hypothetical protein F4Y18_02760 [Cenarchaeum sp. SB0663_bin_5]|nr:hypothetical protein [Cenarchaeum sp. SB0663_bin_5]
MSMQTDPANNRDYTRFVDRVFSRNNQPDEALIFVAGHSVRNNQLSKVTAHFGNIETLKHRISRELPDTWTAPLIEQLDDMAQTLRIMLSTKNSETLDDKGSAVSSMNDKMAKTRTEHVYDSTEEKAAGMLDKIRGDRHRETYQ